MSKVSRDNVHGDRESQEGRKEVRKEERKEGRREGRMFPFQLFFNYESAVKALNLGEIVSKKCRKNNRDVLSLLKCMNEKKNRR